MTNDQLAKLCAGECPFGYNCKAVDCEECVKIRAGAGGKIGGGAGF